LGKVENPAEYSTIAEKLARRAMDAKQWHFAREYWQIKGDWDALGGNQDGCRSTLIEIAGVYMLEIESITSNAKPSFVTASGLMAKRVEALRRAKAEQAEIAKARRLLLEYQQQAEAELSQGPRFEFPENERDRLRTIAEKASERVRGLSFETAILRLALITRPTDPDQIRKRIEKATAQGFISQAFGSTVLRPGGQVADTRPAITMGSVESREDGVRKDMWSQARDVDWPYRTAARIEPARRTIVAEHPARISDLAFIVQHNPFVPHGREILFLRGLHAGLHGDFPLAIHFLPPQIEHSIRTILAAHGVITSKLEPDQRQDERDLGWLLTQPEMERVFSKPITFDLRGLLVERFGENIRNQVAHGMFEVEQMFSPTVCYVWWLALSLCCVPLIRSNKEQATHPTQEPQT
jgi:hypothetical protein